MSFWNTYIIDFNNTEAEEEAEEEYELELDELLSLFNKSIKRSATTLLHNNVTDKMLLGLIKHFYPDIIIEDDKYLIHVGCRSNIWNKRGEIEEFIKIQGVENGERKYDKSVIVHNLSVLLQIRV